MPTYYESHFLDLKMQVPDGWETRVFPDDGVCELAESIRTGREIQSGGACVGTIRHLVFALLYAPGTVACLDAAIKLQACDNEFLSSGEPRPMTEWNVNGISVLHYDVVSEDAPENTYHRFAQWEVEPGLSVYARLQAKGRRRFEYVLSIFETLSTIDSKPAKSARPLFLCPPWTEPATLYRLQKDLSDDRRPLFDLTDDTSLSASALSTNSAILAGREGANLWTPPNMRRKGKALSADCYYGPQQLHCAGIFSERAVELLRPYHKEHFDELPCAVNKKPHYVLVARANADSCLDVEHSQIRRFDDGGIMEIDRYRFQNGALSDPQIFTIAEERSAIFTTSSIPALAAEAGLKGVAFHPIDGVGREYSCPG